MMNSNSGRTLIVSDMHIGNPLSIAAASKALDEIYCEQPPKASRSRSRRLQKKLHVGEFQEFGFTINIPWNEGLSVEEKDAVHWQFVTDCIEPNGLSLSGSDSVYICSYSRKVTEADIALCANWLITNAPVGYVKATQLLDDWYPPKSNMEVFTTFKHPPVIES